MVLERYYNLYSDTVIDDGLEESVSGSESSPLQGVVTNADVVWLLGLPNWKDKSPVMWTTFESPYIDELSQEVKTFLGLEEKEYKSLKASFTQSEQVGLAEISLELNDKRVMFELNKGDKTFTRRLQIKEADEWVDALGEAGDGLSDLGIIVGACREIAQGSVGGSGSA